MDTTKINNLEILLKINDLLSKKENELMSLKEHLTELIEDKKIAT